MKTARANKVQFTNLISLLDLKALIVPRERCGIYFLVSEDRCIYVGQSINIFSRATSHAPRKTADRIYYLICPEVDLDRLECFFIEILKPPLNTSNGNTGWRMCEEKLNSAFAIAVEETVRRINGDLPCLDSQKRCIEIINRLFGGARIMKVSDVAAYLGVTNEDIESHLYDEKTNPRGELPSMQFGNQKRIATEDFIRYFGIS